MEKTKSLQSVDSISAYGTDLRDLEEKIYHMRSIMDEKYLPKSHAFVSFPTIRDAQRAIHLISNKMHFYNKTGRLLYPKVKPCPNFEDLHWDNLGLERNQLLMRRLISYGIFFLLTIGWTAVTGFVASLTNISKIAQVNASIAASIQKTPYGVVVLESIVAPLLLVCLNLLLPLVLRVAAKFQGVTSSNGVERSVLVKFFIFQVYQAAAYIGLNALGAKFIQDAKASGDPASSLSSTTALVEALMQGFINVSFDLLASYMPRVDFRYIQSSTFYMTFIVIGYTAYGIEIIQGVSLLMNLFQRTFFKMTPRQQYTLNQPPSFSYMATYGSLFIAFMVSLAYCLVAPLITPLAASLFGIAYLALKYQMFYVYTTKIENGGNWWPRIFDVTCVVIALFQLMTFGAIVFTAANRSSTGNGKLASLLVAVLMAVTLVVWYTMRRYFNYRANDIQVPVSPRRRGELDCHIYDPCMGKPLDKVWVSKENVVLLSKIYQPIYDNTKEYMIKEHLVGPETLSHQRRMGKRLAYFGLQKEIEWESECMDDAIDRPPELVKAMGLLRSRFGSQSLRQSISVTTLTDKDLMLTEEDFHAS